MKLLSSLSIIALVTTGSIALAKPAEKAKPAAAASEESSEGAEKTYSQPAYGMAGCGLGSMIIKQDGFLQVFAATLNGVGYNQTFGITSGTSNCRAAPKKMAAIEQKVFVETNYAELSREAAQGDGEHLRAFAELLGCDHNDFVRFTKTERANIFAEPKATAVLKAVKAKYKGQCERLG